MRKKHIILVALAMGILVGCSNKEAESDEISEVSIYSASGAAVCKSVVNGSRFSYNVSGLTPGVYFAKVATKSGTEVRKFVVK